MDIVADPRALYESAVTGEIAGTGQIAVSGTDRASYLQGLLTNDIQALTAGSGCYSAWLTPQGRMLTDLHVLESGDMILLDLPLAAVDATLQRLDQFLFSEDAQFADLRGSVQPVWLHGPRAAATLEGCLQGVSNLAEWPAYRNARASFGSHAVVVARIDRLGVKPDLLVTDVVMPGLSGPNLAARLMQQNPTMRILYMSGYSDDAAAVHGAFWGGVPLLQKPFTPAQLVERVRMTLDAASRPA